MPAVKRETVSVRFAEGQPVALNGVEFADYIRPVEVPGSRYVEDLCNGGQVRLITLKLTKKGVAKSLILESPNGDVYVKMTGPAPTVEKAEPAFVQMIRAACGH